MYPAPLTTAEHIANEWPRQDAKLQTANTGLAAPQCRQPLPGTNMRNNNAPRMVLHQPARWFALKKKRPLPSRAAAIKSKNIHYLPVLPKADTAPADPLA